MSPSNIPLVSITLATTCIESCLYGIFLVLFIFSTFLLATRKLTEGGRTHKESIKVSTILRNPFMVSSFMLFISVTAHWLIVCVRLFKAFANPPSLGAPLVFFADLSQETNVVKTGFLISSLLIGDAMIIYRLWIVWGHNKAIIIFPICSFIGLAICGTGITVQFSIFKPGQPVFLSQAERWITSDAVFTLCTNLYSSVAISWRIWRINRSVRSMGARNLSSVLGIIVESAFIYTTWTTYFFAAYQSQSNLQFNAVDCLPAMSGISFMLINVRVGLGWALKSTAGSTITMTRSHGIIASIRGRAPVKANTYPLRPLAVNIENAVSNDHEYDSSEATKASKQTAESLTNV